MIVDHLGLTHTPFTRSVYELTYIITCDQRPVHLNNPHGHKSSTFSYLKTV